MKRLQASSPCGSPPPAPSANAFVLSAPEELRAIIQEAKYRSGLQSAKLIRQLRRRDRLSHKLQKNYDIITACLQAVSQKRSKNSKLLSGPLNVGFKRGGNEIIYVVSFCSNSRCFTDLLFLIMQKQNDPQRTYLAGFGMSTKEKKLPVLHEHDFVPSEVLYSLMCI